MRQWLFVLIAEHRGVELDGLRRHLSQFGAVLRLRPLPDRNCVFAHFETLQSSINARNHLIGMPVG